jgi:hypothetical protein
MLTMGPSRPVSDAGRIAYCYVLRSPLLNQGVKALKAELKRLRRVFATFVRSSRGIR